MIWVETQNGNKILQVSAIEILTCTYGETIESVHIVNQYGEILGTYSTAKRADEVFEIFKKYIAENERRKYFGYKHGESYDVFEMPQDVLN